ncbi:hypothetical protein TNCV_4297781 [Trichonephila clavipes]|nr:hypothetical protein TNCV_4297781 [Trichonephila clavipes]
MSKLAMEESENAVGSLEQLLLYADEHYLAGKFCVCAWETIKERSYMGSKNIINVTLAPYGSTHPNLSGPVIIGYGPQTITPAVWAV